MAKNWTDMVNEVKAEVMGVLTEEAHRTLHDDQDALLVEVRADLEIAERLRDPRLTDRSRKVNTTRGGGQMTALGAQVLKVMRFTNVTYMDGGMRSWEETGLATAE